jgi:hypothetical protein
MASTDVAPTSDASCVANVQRTDADQTAAAGPTLTDANQAQDPFLVLTVCTIEPDQAGSFGVDTARTGQSLGLDASGIGAPGDAD